MRIAELLFLVLLLLYHMVLLVPRYRRAFALNYLVFLSGIALALSLGLEGLRWQMLPPTVLLLVDLVWLFPTFSTLRGKMPPSGIASFTARTLRSVAASTAFLLAVGSVALSVMFPLPQVPLSGGLPVSVRQITAEGDGGSAPLDFTIWYPAAGNGSVLPRLNSSPAWWELQAESGAIGPFWQSYLEKLPSNLIVGGKMARPDTKYPVVALALPEGQSPGEWGYLAEDLASRGFVVIGAEPRRHSKGAPTASWITAIGESFQAPANPALWLNPEQKFENISSPRAIEWSVVKRQRELLLSLNQVAGDTFSGALAVDHMGLLAWNAAPTGVAPIEAGAWAGTVWVNNLPQGSRRSETPELWITADPRASSTVLDSRRWVLLAPSLHWADLSDAAYLKPFLAFVGLKSHPDGSLHSLAAQYMAAFFQFTLWGGDGSLFEGGTPASSELKLLRQ